MSWATPAPEDIGPPDVAVGAGFLKPLSIGPNDGHDDFIGGVAAASSGLRWHFLEDAKRKAHLGHSSPLSGVVVLSSTLVGTAVLAFPHAFAVCGWVLGLALLAVFALLSVLGCVLLAEAAANVGEAPCSFFTVTSVVMPSFVWVIDFVVAVKCFGVATSYLVIAGDLIPDALEGVGVRGVVRWQAVCLSLLVAAPLSFPRNLSSLRFLSSGAVGIGVWTVCLLLMFWSDWFPLLDPCGGGGATAPKQLPCTSSVEPVGRNFVQMLEVLPVLVFGFTCQQNVFTVVNEVMGTSSQRLLCRILLPTYATVALLLAAGALAGYFTFGSDVRSDVLANYPEMPLVSASRLLFALMVCLNFPLQVHPMRVSVLSLLHAASGRRLAGRAFDLLTAVLVLSSFSVAVATSDLGKLLAVVGATGSTTVSYILPGALYWRSARQGGLLRRLAALQAVLGVLIGVLSLTLVLVGRSGSAH